MMGITHANTQLDAFREMKVDSFYCAVSEKYKLFKLFSLEQGFLSANALPSPETEQGCLLYPHAGFALGIGSSGSSVCMGAALTPRNAACP